VLLDESCFFTSDMKYAIILTAQNCL
jgi:hypothetical protein